MKRFIVVGVMLTVVFAITLQSSAQESYAKGKRLAVGDYSAGKMCVIEPDGTVSRTEPAPSCNDLWVLPNDHILYTTGHGVKETDAQGKVYFQYNSKSEIFAVERLADGNTFVGECSNGNLLTIAPDGKIVKQQSLPNTKGGHLYIRNCRVLDNGHYLVCHYGAKKVVEYDADIKEVWSFDTPAGPHSAAREANGNTLIACGDTGKPCFLVVSPDKKVVWSWSNDDMEGNPLKFFTGFQKLPNGNYLFTNWVGHGKFGQAPLLYEVTPDKKVVWTFEDHKNFRAIATVEIMDDNIGNAIH